MPCLSGVAEAPKVCCGGLLPRHGARVKQPGVPQVPLSALSTIHDALHAAISLNGLHCGRTLSLSGPAKHSLCHLCGAA